METMVTSMARVLEEAIEIRTLNTQAQRISENLDFIRSVGLDNDVVKAAIRKCSSEMLSILARMDKKVCNLEKMASLAKDEMNSIRNDLSLEEETLD